MRKMTEKQKARDADTHWLRSLPGLEVVPMTVERRKREVEDIIAECGGDPERMPPPRRRRE